MTNRLSDMDGRTDGRTDGQNGRIDYTDGSRRPKERTDGRTDNWTEELKNETMNE